MCNRDISYHLNLNVIEFDLTRSLEVRYDGGEVGSRYMIPYSCFKLIERYCLTYFLCTLQACKI